WKAETRGRTCLLLCLAPSRWDGPSDSRGLSERHGNAGGETRIALDERDIGLEAAALGQLEHARQKEGGQRLAGDTEHLSLVDGRLDRRIDLGRGDLGFSRYGIADEDAAVESELAPRPDESCDILRSVEANRRGKPAPAAPEGRELVGAE